MTDFDPYSLFEKVNDLELNKAVILLRSFFTWIRIPDKLLALIKRFWYSSLLDLILVLIAAGLLTLIWLP